MKKLFVVLPLSVLLTACLSNPPKPHVASQEEINYYLDNQVIEPKNGEVEHPKYGVMPAASDLYMSDNDSCAVKVYEGKSFSIGTRLVTDSKALGQFSDDALTHGLRAFMKAMNYKPSGAYAGTMAALSVTSGIPMDSQSYEANRKSIFDDSKMSKLGHSIGKLESKVFNCIKAKGWTFVKTDKK